MIELVDIGAAFTAFHDQSPDGILNTPSCNFGAFKNFNEKNTIVERPRPESPGEAFKAIEAKTGRHSTARTVLMMKTALSTA